jgi:hypothetical protein
MTADKIGRFASGFDCLSKRQKTRVPLFRQTDAAEIGFKCPINLSQLR